MRWTLLPAIVFTACGCASKIYVGPTTGISAEGQVVLQRALEDVIDGLELDKFKKKRVRVELYGGPGVLGVAARRTLIYSLIANRLLKEGARLEDDHGADCILSVSVLAYGVDVVRRDLPPFYHHTSFRGTAALRAVAYVPATFQILSTVQAGSTWVWRERYWFYVLGPYQSLWKEPAYLAGRP